MKKYRLFLIALAAALIVATVKLVMHLLDWELLQLGPLHTSVVAGTFFVVGFQLSATISDYKESEKIPADFAATCQNMYEDAATIQDVYPNFDIKPFRKQLVQVLRAFKDDVRDKTHAAHREVHKLNPCFVTMEKASVPPNFIVKLKQEQSQLTKNLLRVNYIQRIKFVPSSTILTHTIIYLSIGLLVFTNVEPFYGGMALTAVISLIFIYMLLLIAVISTPFHAKGETKDDVSLFLIDQAIEHIRSR